jgi:hypothetical protein
MNFKKIVYLFLALVFPIAIFLFLKQFGRNEFNVEPLLKAPTKPVASCEGYTYQFPYTIADSILKQLEWNVSDSLTLVLFDNSTLDDSHERSTQITRVFKEIPRADYRVLYKSDFDIFKTKFNAIRLNPIGDTSNLSVIRSCALWLPAYEDIAVINSKKEIVGKYSLLNREDSDRLILEMKILLHQY